MSETSETRLDVPADLPWQVDTWRLTAFLGPGQRPVDPTWWADLVGEMPEARTSNPRLGIFQEQGPWNDGTLTLVTQPGQVTWLYSTLPLGSEPPLEAKYLGSISDTLPSFRELAHQWLDVAPPIVRLAVGSILYQPATDRAFGYRILAQYLPHVEIDIENSSDFLYRINRPKPSAHSPAVRINRLSTWSTIFIQAMAAPQPDLGILEQLGLYIATKLELDINTAPEPSLVLDASSLPGILGELVQASVEIAEKGDVA
jgi:hypothetical protein